MQENIPGPRRRSRKITRRVKYGSTFEYPLDSTTRPKTDRYTQFLPQKKILLLLVIALLFLGAFAVRAIYVSNPTMEHHPIRQYHSATITRGLYYEDLDSISESRKEVASKNMNREASLEPPVIENLALVSYRIVGGEHIWIPQLMSAIFWLIGGVFLYLIARKLVPTDAAVVSTAFYLFVPYTIRATSTFQPDPLMVGMFIVSIFMILRHHERPSLPRLLLAVTVSALAVTIKPVCIFPILGAFLALAVFRQGFRKSVTNIYSVIFLAVIVLPIAIYYYDDFFTGITAEQSSRFMPNLFLSWYYWGGWLFLVGYILPIIAILLTAVAIAFIALRQMPKKLMILLISGNVVLFIIAATVIEWGMHNGLYSMLGFTALVMALYGVSLFRNKLSRSLMIGLWGGYLCYGLIFNYHIHTHDYYHLLLIPIIALSLGPIFSIIMNRLSEMTSTVYKRAAAWTAIVLVAVTFSLIGLGIPMGPKTWAFQNQVRIAEEIGEYVDHSTNTIFLSYFNGHLLRYHGELSGVSWPRSIDLYAYELQGRPELIIEERLNRMLESSPDYFIVTDLEAFNRQPELSRLLNSRFPEVDISDEYHIFDLRVRANVGEQSVK